MIKLGRRHLDMVSLQLRMYFLGRRLEKDYGFKYNYYGVWSTQVEDTVKQLFEEGKIKPRNNPLVGTSYVITDKGLEEVATYDEMQKMFLEDRIQKIANNDVLSCRNTMYMIITMDKIAQQLGGTKDTYTLLETLNLLGWNPRPETFNYVRNRLGRMLVKYKKRYTYEGSIDPDS